MAEKKIRVAVVGYGRVGQFALEAVAQAPDMELAGVVRRDSSLKAPPPPELKDVAVAGTIQALLPVQVALLCVPTRAASQLAVPLLAQGINTVDSFDLHSQIGSHRRQLERAAQEGGAAAVVAAGWDPGTNSLVRALMELLTPRGWTFTNFGPGLSLGHSAAVKSLPGVRDALAYTLPQGAGLHRRLVYVLLEEGAAWERVRQAVLEDPYFQGDETHLFQVDSLDSKQDLGHGVLLERWGTSGKTGNQQLRWEMRINNPALTAAVLAAAARASLRQPPGAYTMLQIPLIDYLHGDFDELTGRLV